MSWDAVVLRIRGPFRSAKEVAATDYPPLGTLEFVAAAVRSAFPSATWHDLAHARFSLDRYTAVMIELQFVETSNAIYLSVSGSGDPIPALLSFAERKQVGCIGHAKRGLP